MLILPSYEDVCRAAQCIEGVARRTPVLTSASLDERLGAQVFFKAENFQRGGAFKFRGAYNAIAALDPALRARGVVAFSSGNHAQAVALSGRLLGVPATIIMPHDAPAIKHVATVGYGARIITYDRYTQDREALTYSVAAEQNLTLIPPFDHKEVIAGQGTLAKELFEEVGALDVLLVCTGGGGLLAGCALAAHALSPHCAVVGVEPEAGDDARQSFYAKQIITIDPPKTIADGAQTTRIGQLTFALMQRHVRDIVSVSDQALIEAMRFFAERMKIVVEPTGALGTAALLAQRWPVRGLRVGVVISGGNVDLATYAGFIRP